MGKGAAAYCNWLSKTGGHSERRVVLRTKQKRGLRGRNENPRRTFCNGGGIAAFQPTSSGITSVRANADTSFSFGEAGGIVRAVCVIRGQLTQPKLAGWQLEAERSGRLRHARKRRRVVSGCVCAKGQEGDRRERNDHIRFRTCVGRRGVQRPPGGPPCRPRHERHSERSSLQSRFPPGQNLSLSLLDLARDALGAAGVRRPGLVRQ